MHTYSHKHTDTYTQAHLYDPNTHICIYTNTYTDTHNTTHNSTQIHMSTYMLKNRHTHMIHIPISKYIHICKHTYVHTST